MSKKYKSNDLKQIIFNLVSNGFIHIDTLGRQLKDMNLTQEEMSKPDNHERIQKARSLIAVMTVINDVLHPAHTIAYELFPKDAHEFIDQCTKQRDAALTSKIINECTCCKKA